jgi:hypothetical protein
VLAKNYREEGLEKLGFIYGIGTPFIGLEGQRCSSGVSTRTNGIPGTTELLGAMRKMTTSSAV